MAAALQRARRNGTKMRPALVFFGAMGSRQIEHAGATGTIEYDIAYSIIWVTNVQLVDAQPGIRIIF